MAYRRAMSPPSGVIPFRSPMPSAEVSTCVAPASRASKALAMAQPVSFFDRNRTGTIDWFEANTYRKGLRRRVLAIFDADGDGFGDPNSTILSCTQPANYVSDNTDCDDTDINEHPGQTWYADVDGDGYSDGTTDTTSCEKPVNYYLPSELTATPVRLRDAPRAMSTRVVHGLFYTRVVHHYCARNCG